MYFCRQCGSEAKIRRLIIDGNRDDCYYRVACNNCSNKTAYVGSYVIAVQLWNALNFEVNVGGTDDDTVQVKTI